MKLQNIRLLARPKPARHESYLGYCLRLGNANGFTNLLWLRDMLSRLDERTGFASENLSRLTGHKLSDFDLLAGPPPIELGMVPDWQLGMKVTYWNFGHRKWCPECLQETGIWKAEWMLSLQVACPKHQCLLHDSCEACHDHVSWRKGSLYECSCGADFREATHRPAERMHLSIAAHLSRSFQRLVLKGKREHHEDFPELPMLGSLHLAQLCDLLWLFGAYAMHRPGVKPQKIPNHGHISVILPFIAMAMHVLEDWPANFHKLLDEYTKPTDGHIFSLNIYLQEIYQALSGLLIHPELQFLRYEFEQYVHTRWKGKLILRSKLREAHPIINGAEAARLLKLPVKTLYKLVESGEIKGYRVTSSQGKMNWMLERASVETFAQNAHGVLVLKDVESLLRILPSRIKLLAEHGLLKPLPISSGREPLKFRHADINAFLEQLNHDSVCVTPASTGLISVWEITKRWMQGNEHFLAVIRALLDGSLRVVGRTPAERGIRALLVSRDQFKEWRRNYRMSLGYFTVHEAAAHIQMNINLLYHLVHTGIANTCTKPLGYEKKDLVVMQAQELDRIALSYLWGKKLGTTMGWPELHAARMLIKLGVYPVCGPTVDHGCNYVFRCADVLAAISRKPSLPLAEAELAFYRY